MFSFDPRNCRAAASLVCLGRHRMVLGIESDKPFHHQDVHRAVGVATLLPVIDKNPVASSRELLAVLFETGQNRKIPLVDYFPTVTRDIAGAGSLLLFPAGVLSNGQGRKADKKQRDYEGNFMHFNLSASSPIRENGYSCDRKSVHQAQARSLPPDQ